MFGMNAVQIEKLVRTILTVGGTIATTFGWLTTGQVDGITATVFQILGPITTVGTLIWTLVSGMQAKQIAAVAALPVVQAIKLEPTAEGVKLASPSVTPPNVTVAR